MKSENMKMPKTSKNRQTSWRFLRAKRADFPPNKNFKKCRYSKNQKKSTGAERCSRSL